MSEDLAHRQFVALTPYELPRAQAGVAEWCQAKVYSLAAELREHRADLRQAETMHWKRSGWKRIISKTKAQMVYYTKIKQAVESGYLIVPNFETEIVAVRTTQTKPPRKIDVNQAAPEALPPGTGRYVSGEVLGHNREREIKYKDGSIGKVTDFYPSDFNVELNFPAALVKPSILNATDRALAAQLFDRIGVVTGNRRGDPIVVGEIFHPDGVKDHRWRGARRVTFFIAWWLNTRDL